MPSKGEAGGTTAAGQRIHLLGVTTAVSRSPRGRAALGILLPIYGQRWPHHVPCAVHRSPLTEVCTPALD